MMANRPFNTQYYGNPGRLRKDELHHPEICEEAFTGAYRLFAGAGDDINEEDDVEILVGGQFVPLRRSGEDRYWANDDEC